MKKQLITLLMAGLLVVGFGGSALANPIAGPGTQNVTSRVEIPEVYTITIPPTFLIDDVKFGTPKLVNYEITADMSLKTKSLVKVTVDNADISLSNSDDSNKKIVGEIRNNILLNETDTLMKEFTVADNAAIDLKVPFTVTAQAEKGLPAGTYTGTTVFTIAYDAGAVTP